MLVGKHNSCENLGVCIYALTLLNLSILELVIIYTCKYQKIYDSENPNWPNSENCTLPKNTRSTVPDNLLPVLLPADILSDCLSLSVHEDPPADCRLLPPLSGNDVTLRLLVEQRLHAGRAGTFSRT